MRLSAPGSHCGSNIYSRFKIYLFNLIKFNINLPNIRIIGRCINWQTEVIKVNRIYNNRIIGNFIEDLYISIYLSILI